ncbi:hypothetical protein [Burkholderia sp. AW49-1]
MRLGALLGPASGVAAMASLSLWCCAGPLFARVLRTERQWRCVNGELDILLGASIVSMWLQ